MTNYNYGYGFLVTPRSKNMIADVTKHIREEYRNDGYFPVIEYLEFASMNYAVKEAEIMGANLGITKSNGEIWLREDVYDGACDGDGFHRFTVAHEIGHSILHLNQIGFARSYDKDTHKLFCNSEWQANEFAGNLLIPENCVGPEDSAIDVAKRCGVSLECAQVRLKKIRGH